MLSQEVISSDMYLAARGKGGRTCAARLLMSEWAKVLNANQVSTSGPISPVAVHADNRDAFIGVRVRRSGVIEIVYDRVGVRRSIWQIMSGSVGIEGLQEACCRAINADDCIATLHSALASAGVRIECIEDHFGSSG